MRDFFQAPPSLMRRKKRKVTSKKGKDEAVPPSFRKLKPTQIPLIRGMRLQLATLAMWHGFGLSDVCERKHGDLTEKDSIRWRKSHLVMTCND
ncbi:unnamed protein product [Sphenostylis stenocarpa]|uniref:Uncharacterized protein n=1 Tax=Sphenostylis stenocarpa TaxID=92480 RepID=A0AA86SFF5_9FABA|nr:unnamed protein product [Sphenostylis stenocarpa]